jgi:hypothetical protein
MVGWMNEPEKVNPMVTALLRRGVKMPLPHAVYVDECVDPARVAPGVIIHPGCRLRGSLTFIGPDCEIGAEAPATVDDCRLGRGVALKGGCFESATFLDGSSVGSGAHIRPGTLLEEEASAAHSVAFKQTILFPFVTAGSLINFCDCLISGGSDRRNHSEVGSSYIHFNFTPHQDKATASLIGDVPRGVMLREPAIFLGGQGGLVGPARIAFGTIVAAGVICRQDITAERKLFIGRPLPDRPLTAYDNGVYTGIPRLLANNLAYLGNIRALQAWYREARAPFLRRAPHGSACLEGALACLDLIVEERIIRLGEVAAIMRDALLQATAGSRRPLSPGLTATYRRIVDDWPRLEESLRTEPPADGNRPADRARLLAELEPATASAGYLDAMRSLSLEACQAGTRWLTGVVESVTVAAAGAGSSAPSSTSVQTVRPSAPPSGGRS